MQVRTFEQIIPVAVDELFPFFASAHNLEEITPSWLKFKVLDMSTPAIQQGTVIRYRLNLHGVPLSWRTLIEDWNPNRSFIDVQEAGPFKLWHHTHEFFSVKGGTRMVDTLRYELPMGFVGQFFGGKMVERDISGIFDYRQKIISQRFGSST